jgi:hypothetical protein
MVLLKALSSRCSSKGCKAAGDPRTKTCPCFLGQAFGKVLVLVAEAINSGTVNLAFGRGSDFLLGLYIYIYIIYMYIYIYTYICIHMYICVYIYKYMNMNISLCLLYTQLYVSLYIPVYIKRYISF